MEFTLGIDFWKNLRADLEDGKSLLLFSSLVLLFSLLLSNATTMPKLIRLCVLDPRWGVLIGVICGLVACALWHAKMRTSELSGV